MDCQLGSRRCAQWDEIEDAPQIKRVREDKEQGNDHQPQEASQQTSQPPPAAPVQQSGNAPTEQPKFYISAPIQGFTINKDGGCRYLFF